MRWIDDIEPGRSLKIDIIRFDEFQTGDAPEAPVDTDNYSTSSEESYSSS